MRAYSQVGRHENILGLYQVLQDQSEQVLVKEAYTGHVDDNCDIPQLLKHIHSALRYLESRGVEMDYLEPSDIRECFGIWKIANLSKTLDASGNREPLRASTNIQNLENTLTSLSARSRPSSFR